MDTNVGRPRLERKARRPGRLEATNDAGDHDRTPNITTVPWGRNKDGTTWRTKMISPWWKPTASLNIIDGHGFSYLEHASMVLLPTTDNRQTALLPDISHESLLHLDFTPTSIA